MCKSDHIVTQHFTQKGRLMNELFYKHFGYLIACHNRLAYYV